MRKLEIITICILVLCSFSLKAQDFPYHYFNRINPMVNNPSFAAINNKMQSNIASYNVWAGGYKPINDYLVSFSIAPNFKKGKRNRNYQSNVGIGVQFLNEQIGPFNQNVFQIIYAYHIQIDRKNILSFGISGIAENLTIDINSLSPLENNDPRLLTGNNSSFLIDGSFGATLHSENLQLALSIVNLSPGIYRFENNSAADFPNYRKYFFTGNYTFELNNELKLEPAVTFRNSRLSNFNFDSSFTFDFTLISVGFGYRSEKSVFVFANIPFKEFEFSYTSENAFFSKHMIGNAHLFSLAWIYNR